MADREKKAGNAPVLYRFISSDSPLEAAADAAQTGQETNAESRHGNSISNSTEEAAEDVSGATSTRKHKVHTSSLDGNGVFATEALCPGETIFSEPVLVERPFHLITKKGKLTPAFFQYFTDIQNLSLEEKWELLRLHYIVRSDNSEMITDVEDLNERLGKTRKRKNDPICLALGEIGRRACFPFVGLEKAHRLYGGDVIHLNHSCRPNAAAIWDDESRTLILRALHHIAIDEEICISYIDPCMERHDRHRYLGFRCRCVECRKKGPHRFLSESHRSTMAAGIYWIRRFLAQYPTPGEETSGGEKAEWIAAMAGDKDHENALKLARCVIQAARDNEDLTHVELLEAYRARRLIRHARLMMMGAKAHMGEERAEEAEELFLTLMGEVRLMMVLYGFEWTVNHGVMAELRLLAIIGPEETKAENRRFVEALVEWFRGVKDL
ncbi:hypothetical protein KC318_g9926 [Hortaea werneckii]|nr:hypothetical protein KC334_g10126 [Hortaea werneckii]KAI7002258.1 hypothetical protein KC355_g9934 [Hortaea werneckii]KAI7186611.1 hypothetical protein KC324_g7108 [Hortaea werneckii]KAI7581323.1 hypothetical protein KC316_g8501 [Hortaea werneckii]KAI7660687.1 hypothetical protein KC318_g9926 [Hortaea werneckii]